MSEAASPGASAPAWALMSIKPVYADQILAGTKTVELRRRPLPASVGQVVVYASAPTQQVVGAFRVVRQVTLPPASAWRAYAAVAGISAEAFTSYFAGSACASVIELTDVRPFSRPFALTDLLPGLRPPVSWRYLPQELLTRLPIGLGT